MLASLGVDLVVERVMAGLFSLIWVALALSHESLGQKAVHSSTPMPRRMSMSPGR